MECGVNAATITRIGNGDATTRVTVVKIVRVLEKYLQRKIDIDSIEGLNITRQQYKQREQMVGEEK